MKRAPERVGRRMPAAMALLVVLNLVPLAGVVYWGWQSFELIFLYWMENVVIGVFAVARMVVRPYDHPVDYVFPFLLAPFFAFHYGMFTWVHGSFVVSLFGPEHLSGFDLAPAVLEVMALPYMLVALAALAAIQALDWIRDVRRSGPGSGGVRDLMVAPYRRVVVLHLTILGAGFALGALNEPTVGLIILVLVKTGSDLFHWRRDDAADWPSEEREVLAGLVRQMAEKYREPTLVINGREKKFSSFWEMKQSSEYRMLQAILRLVGGRRQQEALTAYLDRRIEQEQGAG